MGKLFLGIDIGGTTAKYSLISPDGRITGRGSFDTYQIKSKTEFLSRLYGVVDGVLDRELAGIGICTLGIVQPGTCEILGGVENLPFLQSLNLRDELGKRYDGLLIRVINDVKAIALAEQWMGAAKGVRNFFCVALGTGLGGAIVLDSRLVEGAHYRAGEIGYLDYNEQGEGDYIEKRLSTQYVMAKAGKELGLQGLDGFGFFDLVRQEVASALDVLDEWVRGLSRLIANIIIVLDLEKVIIGGGISGERDILIPRIREEVERMLPPQFRGQTVIDTAKFSNDAGMLGAVSLLIRE